jgi:3-hydroxyacyl-[acyl-carrier-protein] dehydratase
MKPNHLFQGELYTVKQVIEYDKSRLSVLIVLNLSHEIFKGHFPGNPILPGVCAIQILKEVLIDYLGFKLILKNAGSIKFLSFINPGVNRLIKFDIELNEKGNDNIQCNVSLNYESHVFCRFKGEFKVVKTNSEV